MHSLHKDRLSLHNQPNTHLANRKRSVYPTQHTLSIATPNTSSDLEAYPLYPALQVDCMPLSHAKQALHGMLQDYAYYFNSINPPVLVSLHGGRI